MTSDSEPMSCELDDLASALEQFGTANLRGAAAAARLRDALYAIRDTGLAGAQALSVVRVAAEQARDGC